MPSTVIVTAVKSYPILQLLVTKPIGAEQACAHPGQSPVASYHVTLARLDDLGLILANAPALPEPPRVLALLPEVRLVRTQTKTSCFMEVDAAGQRELQTYVRKCGAALGFDLLDDSRVFHVTLSNAGKGDVRESVGAIWNYPSTVICLAC